MKTDDILDPVENLSISINFIQAYYLLKTGLRFKSSFNSMIQKKNVMINDERTFKY